MSRRPSRRRSLQAASRPSPDLQARAQGFRAIAGVDEAGRGPWAGPVVAAAVILSRRAFAVRIDDSKRLTETQRRRAYHAILTSAHVGIGIVCAHDVDRWNILQASLEAMRLAIADLTRTPDVALVDGNSVPALTMPAWPIVHGDRRSVSIACASIVAKVVRDELMAFYDALFPRYAFSRHKGYGTSLHARALARWGPSILHRMSFEPVRAHATAESPIASA